MASVKQIDFLAAGVFNSSGIPLAGGSAEIFESGTTTPTTIWKDANEVDIQTNPVTLGERGQAVIFVDREIDILVKDVNGNTVFDYEAFTYDILDTQNFGIDASKFGSGDNFSAILDAINSAAGADAQVFMIPIPGGWDGNINLTVPSNINLLWLYGAYAAIPLGITLTYNGTWTPILYQIHRGAGALVYADRNSPVLSINLINGVFDSTYFSSNVGINTTTPTATLDVQGNVVISENLTVDTDTLFVDSVNNRVGINTLTPNFSLEAGGTAGPYGAPAIGVCNLLGRYLYLSAGTTETSMIWQSGGTLDFGVETSIGVGFSEIMRISDVGINLEVMRNDSSLEPLLKISNTGSGDSTLNFEITGQDWSIGIDNSDSDKLKIGTNATATLNTGLVIETSGNVGIGTAFPDEKLHVNQGNILIDRDGVSGDPYLHIVPDSGTGDSWMIGIDDDLNYLTLSYGLSGGSTPFGTVADKLQINATGDIGVGQNPTTDAKLSILTTSKAGLQLDKTGDANRNFLRWNQGDEWWQTGFRATPYSWVLEYQNSVGIPSDDVGWTEGITVNTTGKVSFPNQSFAKITGPGQTVSDTVAFDNESFDNDSFFDISTDDEITFVRDGVYIVNVNLQITGFGLLSEIKFNITHFNSIDLMQQQYGALYGLSGVTDISTNVSSSAVVKANAGDYIKIVKSFNTFSINGASLNVVRVS